MKNRTEYNKHIRAMQINEWSHPLLPQQKSASKKEPFKCENIVNQKEDVNFWTAQFAHLLKAKYHLNNHEIADILLLQNAKKVNRAIKKYPELLYKTIDELETDLKKGDW